MTNKLSQSIESFYYTGRSPETVTLSYWVNMAQALEDQLSGTAQRAKDFEIECLNKAGAIDELIKQRDEARDDLANKQNIVDNNRKIIDALRQTQTQLERERDYHADVSEQRNVKITRMQQEYDDTQARHGEQYTLWGDQIARLEKDRDNLTQEVNALRAALRTANQSNAYLSDYERACQLGGTGTINTKASSGCGGIAATPQSMESLATEAARKALADGSWKHVPELCNIVATIAHKLINGTTK